MSDPLTARYLEALESVPHAPDCHKGHCKQRCSEDCACDRAERQADLARRMVRAAAACEWKVFGRTGVLFDSTLAEAHEAALACAKERE